jgi:hypothetical protein
MGAEILHRHRAVVGAARERDALGDRPAIEALALRRGDVLERLGLLRAIEALARIGARSLGRKVQQNSEKPLKLGAWRAQLIAVIGDTMKLSRA